MEEGRGGEGRGGEGRGGRGEKGRRERERCELCSEMTCHIPYHVSIVTFLSTLKKGQTSTIRVQTDSSGFSC